MRQPERGRAATFTVVERRHARRCRSDVLVVLTSETPPSLTRMSLRAIVSLGLAIGLIACQPERGDDQAAAALHQAASHTLNLSSFRIEITGDGWGRSVADYQAPDRMRLEHRGTAMIVVPEAIYFSSGDGRFERHERDAKPGIQTILMPLRTLESATGVTREGNTYAFTGATSGYPGASGNAEIEQGRIVAAVIRFTPFEEGQAVTMRVAFSSFGTVRAIVAPPRDRIDPRSTLPPCPTGTSSVSGPFLCLPSGPTNESEGLLD